MHHAFSYSPKMFILQDLSFLHKGVESLIFKLEMCVLVFINKIVRLYWLYFIPFSSIYTDNYLQYDKGAIQSA